MRKVVIIIVCLISQWPAFAQTAGQKDVLSIQDAMSISSYRRSHPMVNDEELDGFIKSVISKYDYKEEDFLEGVGTCLFWQYIKHGHSVRNEEPLDDDYYVPDNKSLASAIAVTDCCGIETIEYDETSISTEIRVFTEARRDELMKEMQDIGFEYKKTEYYGRVYSWKSFTVSIYEGRSRGHKYWRFTVGIETRDYGSTKHYVYADSSSIHNVKIKVDYPVKGNPVLLRRVRTFIMEALELDLQNGGPLMGRFNGNPSEGQAVVNDYGVRSVALLREKSAGSDVKSMEEDTEIRKIAENDYFISFEVVKIGWYNPYNAAVLCYGATFRKSDGKRLKIITNPQDPKFKELLNFCFPADMKGFFYDPDRDIPLPYTKPYLLQTGVRFVYQKREIAGPDAEYIVEDIPYSVIRPLLSEEVKEVLK
jgi:hypothetical protein